MKKLFSIGVLLVALFLLSACEEGNDETETLQQEIEQMQQRLDGLEVILEDKSQKIDDLEEELSALESKFYDGELTFSIMIDDQLHLERVAFNELDDYTAFDLLQEAFEVEYDTFDFGIMLNQIGDLKALQGSFIEISKNDEPLDVGISEASYEPGDHFHFERTWYDEDAKAIYEMIDAFLSNHVDDYIIEDELDMNVVLGLYHLGVLDEYELNAKDKDLEAGTSSLINQIFIRQALGEETESLKAALLDENLPSHLYPASLYTLALNDHDDAIQDGFIDLVEDAEVKDLDFDTLVLTMLALELVDFEGKEDLLDSMRDYLLDDPTNHAYGENATTYAWVLMFYGANEIPLDEGFEETNLLEVIIDYHDGEGAFYYTSDSEDVDLMFTTPQMFMGLAYYFSTIESMGGHPFIIGE